MTFLSIKYWADCVAIPPYSSRHLYYILLRPEAGVHQSNRSMAIRGLPLVYPLASISARTDAVVSLIYLQLGSKWPARAFPPGEMAKFGEEMPEKATSSAEADDTF